MQSRILEHIEIFEEELGEIQNPTLIHEETYRKYTGVLPDALLTIWKKYGWGCFADGLFWIVNPEDYEDLVSAWLEKTPYEEIDQYHAIARNAFGKLYVWGQNNNQYFTISCPMHALIIDEKKIRKKSDNPDSTLGLFFSGVERDWVDMKDEKIQPLFLRALEKLGPLKADEVYGFELPLFAGGRLMLDNLAKVKIDQYLTLLRQMGGMPKIPFANVKLNY